MICLAFVALPWCLALIADCAPCHLCAAVPVLIPFGAAMFTLLYWVRNTPRAVSCAPCIANLLSCDWADVHAQYEKFSILKVFRKPTNYGLNLARFVMLLLPYSIVINLVFTTWVAADPQMLPSDEISESQDSRCGLQYRGTQLRLLDDAH